MLTLDSHQKNHQVSKFLTVELPTSFEHILFDSPKNKSQNKEKKTALLELETSTPALKVIQRLYQADIHNLIPERAPGLKISKAAICEIEQTTLIIAPFHILEETCAGHMPGFPFLPLAEAGRVLAQVGAILVGYHAKAVEKKEGWITPLVYKVGEVISNQAGYLVPGDSVCIVAKAQKLRGPLYAVQAHGYLNQVPIFSMPKIHYFVTDDQKLWGRVQ